MSASFRLLLIFAAIMLGTAFPVLAQETPPPLRDFTLKPGPKSEEQPPSKVQGPVADGQKPRDTLSPPPPAASPQAETNPRTEIPVRKASPQRDTPPADTSRTVQALPPVRQSAPLRQTAPKRSAPPPPPALRNENALTDIPRQSPSNADISTTTSPADESSDFSGIDTSATDDGLQDETGAVPDSADTFFSGTVWAAIAALLAALGAVAFLFLRRRSASSETVADYAAPDSAHNIVRQPSPPIHPGISADQKPERPADQQSGPLPKSANPRGFVTSSLRLGQTQPQPAPFPARPQSTGRPTAPAMSSGKGDLRIAFVAETAGSTLLNAVLGYRITLHNDGTETLKDLALSGLLAQASGDVPRSGTGAMQAIGNADSIAPGQSVELKGEIRLPLAQIEPISYNRQSLFVPVVHFICAYAGNSSERREERHSFIVGREHEPPRAKMAPFRLDQGPRNFRPVGQRLLVV